MTGVEGVVDRLGSSLTRDQAAELEPWVWIFTGEERQLRAVREWLAALLPAHPALGDILSIVTELATNAIRHTRSGCPGGSFAVVVTRHLDDIRVGVADRGGLRKPHVLDDPDGESGRGLLIVLRLAARVGVRGDHWGRLVWADIPGETAVGADQGVCEDDILLSEVGADELPQVGDGERALRQLQEDGII